jgi:hypothetical protein
MPAAGCFGGDMPVKFDLDQLIDGGIGIDGAVQLLASPERIIR